MIKTVGILGAGQLAQMLAVSAYQLGLNTLCYNPTNDAPAARLSSIFCGELDNRDALQQFAAQVDVITLETENIPDQTLKALQKITEVQPGELALKTAQDRLLEKQLFDTLDIPCVTYKKIDQLEDLEQAPYPGILKTRTLGYDGKGQYRLQTFADAEIAWTAIKKSPAIFEKLLCFDSEVSQIATRNRSGEIVFYPLIDNHHQHGILRTSICPAPQQSLSQQAQHYCKIILEALDYVGTLALELFVKDNRLYVNEIAPRVHNSGHLTTESTNCSQFENHLRAVCNLTLIQPKIIQSVKMHNIIGHWPHADELKDATHIYHYGKTERPGRKLGHWIQVQQ